MTTEPYDMASAQAHRWRRLGFLLALERMKIDKAVELVEQINVHRRENPQCEDLNREHRKILDMSKRAAEDYGRLLEKWQEAGPTVLEAPELEPVLE